DPQARIEMRHILLRLAEMGKTLIVTSHILPELSRICDTVAIISQGKLRAFGTLEQIMRQIRQQRTMEVQLLATGNVDRAAELLRQQLNSNSTVTPSASESLVRFTTEKSDEELSRVLMTLSKQDVPILQYREMEHDLED